MVQPSEPEFALTPSDCCDGKYPKGESTLPPRTGAQRVHESLRWPPHLERAEIVRRLVEIRDFGPLDTSAILANVEAMSPAQIAAAVIAALARVQVNRGHEPLEHQLQILALNLKNLH